ncbi:MAG: MMPL family transporter, partial [Methylotetracoccus sp.]|nr:MMPL family transporter [Methylotetracoccus sp.]
MVLEGAPREEMESFAAELTARLREEPEIGQVNAHLDTEFLLHHAYLLMPPEGLDRIGALLNGKVRRGPLNMDALLAQAADSIRSPPAMGDVDVQAVGQSLQSAALLFEEWQRWLVAENGPVDLDFGPLLSKYGAAELAKGDFSSRDGRMLFIFVHPKNASEDFEVRGPFIDKVRSVAEEASERVRAAGRSPPRVGLAGLPAAEYEEYVDIERDIILVIVTAIVLIALLILVVVRSFRWALAIFVPMGLGALWSQALVLFTVGHLTIITSGFIAILFGLGADYGIFTSSRIAEERQAGRPLLEAIGVGIGASFGAVLTAGGASLAIFGALATVEFPGFAELGVVATGGVLLILLSTWIVQPALYALLPPRLRLEQGAQQPLRRARGRSGVGAFPIPFAVALVTVAVACAAVGAGYGFALPFDYDALALLPNDSEAAHYERRMGAESDYQSEVVIFTAPELAEARRITEAASQLDSIGKVQSLTHLFPLDAEARSRTARFLAASAARAGYQQDLTVLQREGLQPPVFERLRALLGTSLDTVDHYQEQAFSAGHSTLVKDLERLRTAIVSIRGELDRDPEQGRERSEALLRRVLHAAGQGLTVVEGWHDARPLIPEQLPPTLRDRFFASD